MDLKYKYLIPFVGIRWCVKDDADMVVEWVSVVCSSVMSGILIIATVITLLTKIYG